MTLRISQVVLDALLKRHATDRLSQAGVIVPGSQQDSDLRVTDGRIEVISPLSGEATQLRVSGSGFLFPRNPVQGDLRMEGAGAMVIVDRYAITPPSTDQKAVTSQYILVAGPVAASGEAKKRVTEAAMMVAFKQTIAIPKRNTSMYGMGANIAYPKQRVTTGAMMVAIWQGSVRISQLHAQVARRRFKVLSSEVNTVAFMLTIERKDGVIKRFTSLDKDLEWQGDVYKSCNSFTPTAVDSSTDMSVDNLDMQGVLDTDDIDEDDLLTGLYNDAKVVLFIVDWTTLGPERYILRTGKLGKITQQKQQFTAEVRGLLQQAQEVYGGTYQATCRATFCDRFCKLNAADFTTTGVPITGVTNNRVFDASSLAQADGYFSYGLLTFTSGENEGLTQEIKDYTTGHIEMWEEFPYTIAPGDQFTIVAGCDKKKATCKDRFNNLVNFRGEPDVPGNDSIAQYPDAKQ